MILPDRPVRAALSGLALYDAVLPHQRLALRVARAQIRLGLGPLMRLAQIPPPLDVAWWRRWLAEVGEGAVGRVGHLAFLLPEGRVLALLMDHAGTPRAFAKVRDGVSRASDELEKTILDTLERDPPKTFRVPAVLAQGELNGRTYLLLEPLPTGRHGPLHGDPPTVGSIVEELQDKLQVVPRPAGCPSHHVLGHGDLTPRNLRLAPDGQPWLFDWEDAGWMPRLADEVRYWTASYASRRRPRPTRDALRVLEILRRRGSDEEILEAVDWPEYNLPAEEAIRASLKELIRTDGSRPLQ